MFSVPTNFAQTTLPSYNPPATSGMAQNSSSNPLNQRGQASTTQVPQQPTNPLTTAANTVGAFKTGTNLVNGASKLWGDASNLYDRFTMPSGVTPGSVMAGSGPAGTSDAFMAGGELPAGGMSATGGLSAAAPNAAFLGSAAPATEGLAYSGAAGSAAPSLATASGLGSGAFGTAGLDAGIASADAAGTTAGTMGAAAAGDAAATAGGEAAAGLGAEAAAAPALAALGPIGLVGGGALLAGKLFGWF